MSKQASFPFNQFLHPRFWLLWLGLGFLRLLAVVPFRLQLICGRGLGWLMYIAIPYRRRIGAINLELCFPELSNQQRSQLLREHFSAAGISMIETAISWWASDNQLKPLHQIEGIEHLEAARENGRGVLLMSAHFTTLEIGGRLLSLHTPFEVMYRKHNNPLFEAVMLRSRQSHYSNVHERRSVRNIAKSLKAGNTVWYAPDQDYGRKQSIFAPFFGVPTATITATARFAKISGAAVVPFFQERLKDGSGYRLRILPEIENYPTGDDVADATTINAIIEAEVRQYPEQYLWVHRRFKTRPEGLARPYPSRNRQGRRKRHSDVA